jgi:hypothetical protein
MPERRGRRQPAREEAKRTNFNTRLRVSVKKRLQMAADKAGRSLSEQIEHVLATWCDPVLPDEDRNLSLLLAVTYRHGGPSAIIRLLMTVGDPDEEERQVRWERMNSTIQELNPRLPPVLQSECVPADEIETSEAAREQAAEQLINEATRSGPHPYPAEGLPDFASRLIRPARRRV